MYRWSSLYEIWNFVGVFALAVARTVDVMLAAVMVMETTMGTAIVDISDYDSQFSMHKSSFETQSKLFTLLLLLSFMLLYALIKWKSIFFYSVC